MSGEETALSVPLMSAASHDPFYVVKDELVNKLESISSRLERYENLLWKINTAASVEFKEVKKGLSREVKAAEAQIKDLALTVEYVEKDRNAFAHIDDRELDERKKFIATTKNKLSGARDVLTGPKARAKIEADEKQQLAATRGNYGAKTDIEMANTDFIHNQHAQTRTIMQEQDENLEHLDSAVDRVHRMATEIHGELKTQSRLIGDLENEMDETTEKMNFVMGKLAKLLKTKDTCQLLTIVILTIVLILLILLLIWS
uniref:t-SNARE coiled-coil homology domain-containing protein n=1 Tax=Aureoumbra lagunensis TaxID=44058 RepID=A0A7S3K6G0_9STRA|mmetsp:Transcript_19199/g.24914  ORF Transcript_19199/g.24914 Transcript_19199/m.24914 type:complete len:259 (-) Transcript_19199:961-1737(-)